MAFCFVLNRLLDRETWARERLAAFAGSAIELRAPLLPPLRFAIAAGGSVAATLAEPTLVASIKPGFLAALGKGEEALTREVDVLGDAKLAAELLVLARHLRWDVEQDLSRVLGDIAAHRVVSTAKAFGAWQREALQRLAESAVAYATEETRALVLRAELEAHAGRVAALRDAVERLARRIERLG